MGVSKVEFGGDTLIDLTSDTVTPETLAEGETAHNAAGEEIKGTLKVQDEIVTTTGTGEIYEATVRGITELKNGISFVMIPHETNTNTSPKLNVNGLGEINIWRRISTGGFISVSPNLLLTGVPYRVVFCENMFGSGSHIWELADIPKPAADDLTGLVPVANGGMPIWLGKPKGNVLTINESGTPEWQEPTGGGSSTDESMVGTWVFNDVLNAPTEEITYQLQFISTTSNGIDNNYRNISVYKPYPTEDFFVLRYSRGTARYTDVYAFSDSAYQDYKPYWQNEEWKTIKITQEPEDGNTIAWIKANAQKAGQQQESDARLKTKSKRLVDAINEISDKIDEGGGTEPSPAIIDVVELPTENIDEDMFYRVVTGTALDGHLKLNNWKVYIVETLPSEGEMAWNGSNGIVYYQIKDGVAYGYVTTQLSQMMGVPAGWYPGSVLVPAVGYQYGGIVHSYDENRETGTIYLLLEYTMHYYKGSWHTITEGGDNADDSVVVTNADWSVYDPEAEGYVKNRTHYEVPTVVDISWDGDMTDRLAIDLAPLGQAGMYLVKVSDKVYTKEELVGKIVKQNDGTQWTILSVDELEDMFDGAFAWGGGYIGVIYSSTEFNEAVGAPEGYYTNGTYFFCAPSYGVYFSELFTEGYVKRLDDKFLPETTLVKRIIDASGIKCVVGEGWSTPTSVTIPEGVAGGLLECIVGITYPDNLNSIHNLRGLFAMSPDEYYSRGVGYIYDRHSGHTLEVYLSVYTVSNRVSVAAKIVSTTPSLTTTDNYDALETTDKTVIGAINEVNEKVNASGGGSSTPSVSLIGTWTVIEDPEIPTSDIPLEFTSNGTEYIGIGSTSMGSSSWGINALSYKSPEGYYEAAYVNNPSGSYGIDHGWRNEAYRYLTVTKEPESREAIAWLGNNTDAPKVELPKEEMPQIRFANFQDTVGGMILRENNPFTFTVEIVGGGELKVGDLLQICVRRKYWYKDKESDVIKHKWKLRRVLQREITAEDIGKRFLSITVTEDDVMARGNWMFRNDRKTSNVDTHSYMYFRIKRATKWSDTTGEECDAIFSNVEKVAKTYTITKKLAIK